MIFGENVGRQRMLLLVMRPCSISDIASMALQRVLIHGVVVIHIELHLRDDAAELRQELSEHAGFVHQAQRRAWVTL
jgi:hypothetical protein